MTGTPSMIARFRSLPDAEAARSALEAAGFDVLLADDNLVRINWLYSQAIGGIRLFVRDDEADEAKAFLTESLFASDASFDVDGRGEAVVPIEPPRGAAPRCPECGSPLVRRLPRMAIVALAALTAAAIGTATGEWNIAGLMLAIVFVIVFAAPSHRCRDCAASFSPAASEASWNVRPAETPDESCPRCGSAEVSAIDRFRVRRFSFFFIAVGVMLWIPLLLAWPFLDKRQCHSCTARW